VSNALTLWWHGLTRREQLLLMVALILFAFVLGWLGIIKPLQSARADSAARLAAATADLGEITAQTPMIRAAEARVRGAGAASTIETVRRRVAEAGMTVEGIADDGAGRVTLRIPAIKPAAFLKWIADIETNDGVVVDQLKITRNGDATIAVDLGFRGASQ
jgi:general secretion pathway protein M